MEPLEQLDQLASLKAEHTTFRVSDYLGWQRDGSLELRPKFQRGSVWTAPDKSLLIDSVMRGFPVPMVILQEELHVNPSTARRRVVDGQQRLRTLISYIDAGALTDAEPYDGFTYKPPGMPRDDDGIRFGDLSPELQRHILGTKISAVILGHDTSDAAVLEVYDRLNSTGLSLSKQELRFAKRSGPFADLCYRLARQNQSRWTGWRILREAEISRMTDVEFTSELILLVLDGVRKTGKREIDDAYSNRDLTDDQVSYAASAFQFVMDALEAVYASPATPDRVRNIRTRAWYYSVFSWCLVNLDLLQADGDTPPAAVRTRAFGKLTDAHRVGDRFAKEIVTAADSYRRDRSTDAELTRAVSGAASDRRARQARLQYLLDHGI